jgi:hypothetical protein
LGRTEELNLLLAPGAELNHFVDVNKMVCRPVQGNFAGGFCLGNGGLVEIAPFSVAKKLLEIASQPVFDTVFGLLGMALKGVGQCLYLAGFHYSPRVSSRS